MKIKIDLQKILDNATLVTQEFSLSNFTYKENVYSTYQSLYGLKITRTSSNATMIIYAGGSEVTKNGSQILTLSATNDYVVFDCDWAFTTGTSFESLLKLGYISYDIDGKTALLLYKQNSENDALNKTLTYVDTILGKFNHSIGLKSLNVDVVNIPMNFNYVYIPSLNRYYYVDSVEIISNDVRRLHLKEDVLMSWKDLIRNQQGFILRSEKLSNDYLLKDDRRPLADRISFSYYTNLVHGNLKNVTFSYNAPTESRFLISSISSLDTLLVGITTPPSGSNLPTISTHISSHDCIRFATFTEVSYVIDGAYNDSPSASFINAVLWLPFDPLSVFGATSNSVIYVGNKYLNTNGRFVPLSSTDTALKCYGINQNNDSPYLVLADFMFAPAGGINITADILEVDSYWEIYIPFVGWVNVDLNKVYGHRILVYYTMDLKTGISTAYVYDYTNNYVLYSTTCTLGIQVDVSTTNQLENTRQKQANDLNMLMSTLTSVISIGVGVATENPVAAVGGLLTLGKAAASYVNNNNMIFDRANTSFGTPDGALHSPNNVIVRRSYHAPLTINTTIYKHTQGYPTNKYDYLSSYQNGYVEIGEIHFDPQDEVIYQDEINEIVTLLKEGVIL